MRKFLIGAHVEIFAEKFKLSLLRLIRKKKNDYDINLPPAS